MTEFKEIPSFIIDMELPAYTVLSSGCWKTNLAVRKSGYCSVGRRLNYKLHTVVAHRLFYTKLVGVIPKGLTLDHLCRNRFCVNPSHLEPVTFRENWYRGTTQSAESTRTNKCKNGHAFTKENTYLQLTGKRVCRICVRNRENTYHRKRKSKT